MGDVLTGRDIKHASAVRRQGHDTVLGSSEDAHLIRGKRLDCRQPHIGKRCIDERGGITIIFAKYIL